MEERKNKFHYTAENIRRYLEGQLPPMEMQAMEKAALEDPFLADAIEGFQESLNQPVSFESGMKELNKRLSERINTGSHKKRSGILLINWQVAASVALIIGIAVLVMTYLTNKNTKADLAKIIKRDSGGEKTNPVPAIAPAKNTDKALTLQHTDEDSIATALNDQVQPDKKSSQNIEPKFNKKKKNIYPDKNVNSTETEKSFKDSSGFYEDENPVAALNRKEPKISPAPTPAADQQKASVPGLSIEDSSRGQSRRGETKLDEVTVVGYGSMKRKDVTGSNTVIVSGNNNNIEPQNGWNAYYNYLKNKKQIPASDSLLKGEETISFIVHPNGKLSSFKIEKSVSALHDAELIRLVKEGPAWKISGGKKQRCRLTFYFE